MEKTMAKTVDYNFTGDRLNNADRCDVNELQKLLAENSDYFHDAAWEIIALRRRLA